MYSIFEPVAVFKEEEGGWSAFSPNVEGAISEGDTLDEARENIKEAIEGVLESVLERKVLGGICLEIYQAEQGDIVETVDIDERLRVAVSIKVAREKNGFTQKDLAESIGKNQQDISRWEGGTVIPAADMFLKMVKV